MDQFSIKMTMKTYTLLILILFSFSAIQAQVFDMVWQTDQVLKTPESVYYDEARDQIYVSNINGKPLDKDGNGFIALLARDGSIKKMKWVTGMHAPKGMILVDSLLYVTDIDRIHVIDVTKAAIVKTYDQPDAMFLNDMTKDHLGRIYISDMQKSQILRLKNDTITNWLEGESIPGVNGLEFHSSNLIVGTKNQLLKIDPNSKAIKVFVDETGPIDGLVWVGGSKYVISDWSGRIQLVSPSLKLVLGNSTDENIQAADLGYIPEEKLILIPTFFDNRVVARRLP
jgi:DNA-binding beta-propeller fold protein YncE